MFIPTVINMINKRWITYLLQHMYIQYCICTFPLPISHTIINYHLCVIFSCVLSCDSCQRQISIALWQTIMFFSDLVSNIKCYN